MATTDATTTSCSASSGRRARRRSRRPSARSRASCIPTSPTSRTPRSGSTRWSRRTRCSRTRSAASSTTASATRDCGAAASRRRRRLRHARRPLLGLLRRRPLRGRRPAAGCGAGADVAAEVEIELVEAARGVRRDVPFEVAVTCATCDGTGAEPGAEPVTCPTCGGGGRIQQVSQTVFGEFVRTQTCGRCGGAGRVIEHPCPACEGAGRVLEERKLAVEIPAGIHDGQRIRLGGEGHAGALGGRVRRPLRPRPRRPDERFVREGNDIYSTVDLTMTQAALGATVTVPTLDGDVELEFEPGHAARHVRVLRGRGMPVLQGRGRGDQRLLVNVADAAPPERRAAPPARGSSSRRQGRRPTGRRRASSTG